MLSSPPSAIGKITGESEFKDSPNQTKYLYIHPLCGGGQSATHHGAYVEWQYLDMATVELCCKNCGRVETHKLDQRGGLRNPAGGRPALPPELKRVRCGDITLPQWLHTALMVEPEPAGHIIERWALENGYSLLQEPGTGNV